MYALKHFLSIDNSMRHCGREYNKKDCPSPGRFPQGGQSFICEKNYFEENYFGNDDPIVWTFVYKQYNRIPYQVQFVVKEKDGTERPAFRVDENGKAVFMETYDQSAPVYVELHTQNDKAVVTEHYKPDDLADTSWVLPGAFLPNALRQQLVVVPALNADGGGHIYFGQGSAILKSAALQIAYARQRDFFEADAITKGTAADVGDVVGQMQGF
jgi:hypothetical protein